jgi:hypothetical protein
VTDSKWSIPRRHARTKISAVAHNLVLKAVNETCRATEHAIDEAVMLHGGLARDGWRRFRCSYPSVARPLRVVETFHTSRTAFRHSDPAVRQARLDDLRRAFIETAQFLGATIQYDVIRLCAL